MAEDDTGAAPDEPGGIIEGSFVEILQEKYLAYALSTIVSRSLPDVRDGLKPVHRRLLYAMRQLQLNPEGQPKKSARIVGDVIGRYHPHGDTAVYDALVRLAQDFSSRYPLVYGQGNFGNIDGDNAAAMRYTEARLTSVASALLEGINEDAVDFRPTYDGDGEEPEVLPAAFPNLLANGASGIAVGMATNIPPHHAGELCRALRALIKKPSLSLEDLVDLVPGPDFPTGGLLVEDRAAIAQAYATGRGGFRVRARWVQEMQKGGTWQIAITEIPYQVQKARLIERIAQLITERKLPLLDDVRDESAEDVRIVLVPRARTVDPAVLMESLFRNTELESRFSLNMNVLDRGLTPKVMGLREVLQAFLDHRHEVLERRSRHRLGVIEARLEILEGLLVAYLNLDEVIRIIREEDEPKKVMIARFDLSDRQAEAILSMQLRSLRKLEEMKIRKEYEDLTAEHADLTDLLGNEKRRWKVIDREIADMERKFGDTSPFGPRRTEIAGPPAAISTDIEAFVEREPITVLLSEKGWIRAVKGHNQDLAAARYKEGDGPAFALEAWTTDRIILVADQGRAFTLAGDRLPGGRGFGEPVGLMAELGTAQIIRLLRHEEEARYVIASTDGRGFIIASADLLSERKAGKQVMNPAEGALVAGLWRAEGDHIAVIGTNRKMLVFSREELPEMAKGRGVILQKYKQAGLSDLTVFRLEEGLSWQLGERTRSETDLRPWIGKRASSGRLPPVGFPKSNRFSG